MQEKNYIGYTDIDDSETYILCTFKRIAGMTLDDKTMYEVKDTLSAHTFLVPHIKNIETSVFEEIKSKLKNGSALEDCVRICSTCGKVITEGYTDTCDAYCSLKCLGMTKEKYDSQYSDDTDCCFYTEWE